MVGEQSSLTDSIKGRQCNKSGTCVERRITAENGNGWKYTTRKDNERLKRMLLDWIMKS